MAKANKQEVVKQEETNNVPAVFGAYKIKRRVTMPTINPPVDKPCIFRIEDAMRESTYKEKLSADGTRVDGDKKPGTVCTVVDVETGLVGLWLMPSLAVSQLNEAYPDDAYVGRVFGFKKLTKRPGKKYFDIELIELEANDD